MGFLSLSIVLSIGIIVLLSQYFDSPKEASLKKENSDLKLYYQLMQDQVATMDNMLGVLQQKDDNVYRTVFDATAISEGEDGYSREFVGKIRLGKTKDEHFAEAIVLDGELARYDMVEFDRGF